MYTKAVIALAGVLYILVLPYQEISATHLFSPVWSGHARMHEVWQLGTHASLAVFALWLAYVRNQLFLAATVSQIVTFPFVFAYIIRGSYGGDMFYSDGSELLMYGINPAFGIMVVLSAALGLAMYLTRGDITNEAE